MEKKKHCGDKPGKKPDRMQKTQMAFLRHIAAELDCLRKDWALFRSQPRAATKADLKKTEKTIMSAFSEWAAKNGPKLTRIQAGVDKLQELIEKIQNSPGSFSPEDQATADEMERVLEAIGTDSESIPAVPTPA